MNYYNKIKNKIIDNEVNTQVKDYLKEKHKIITYYEIGRLLSQAKEHYLECNNFIMFLIMKKCPRCGHN